jgi:hypothetical protein
MTKRFFAILLLLAAAAFSQETKPRLIKIPAKRALTHETLWLMPRVGSPVPSPDGKWVVFSINKPAYDEKEASSDLWLVPAEGGAEPRQITDAVSARHAAPRRGRGHDRQAVGQAGHPPPEQRAQAEHVRARDGAIRRLANLRSHDFSQEAADAAPERCARAHHGQAEPALSDERPRMGDRPYLRMSGRWLEQSGFAAGTRVYVKAEHGRLILTNEDPALAQLAHS